MPTCPKCQNAVDPAARFCPACGTVVAITVDVPTSATFPSGKPKSWKEFKTANAHKKPPKAFTAIIFVLIILVPIFLVSAFIHSSNSGKTNITPGPKTEETPMGATYRIKDSVTVGYWSYRVNATKWASSVGPEGLRQTADAKFLILTMTVRNNDKTASTLPPVKLVDAQGREFDESSAGMMLENAFGPLKKLNPTVQSSGLVLFDVPQGKYWAVVSGGMTSSETAKIELN